MKPTESSPFSFPKAYEIKKSEWIDWVSFKFFRVANRDEYAFEGGQPALDKRNSISI